MLRGCFLHEPSIFEDSSVRDLFHYVETSYTDEFGDTKYKYDMIVRSSKTPFTPQSGLETQLCSLSFMVRSNLAINHEPSYLTLAKNGNPFEQYLAVKNAASIFEKTQTNDLKK